MTAEGVPARNQIPAEEKRPLRDRERVDLLLDELTRERGARRVLERLVWGEVPNAAPGQ